MLCVLIGRLFSADDSTLKARPRPRRNLDQKFRTSTEDALIRELVWIIEESKKIDVFYLTPTMWVEFSAELSDRSSRQLISWVSNQRSVRTLAKFSTILNLLPKHVFTRICFDSTKSRKFDGKSGIATQTMLWRKSDRIRKKKQIWL